jgi:hypothetical protein
MDLFLIDKYYNQSEAEEFQSKVFDVCSRVKCNPDYLMAIMYFESRLRPFARNSNGSGVGLIQFYNTQAIRLGTTTDDLEFMTGVEQMDIIEKHLSECVGYFSTLADTWICCYYQKMVGCNFAASIRVPSKYREANKVFPLYDNNKIRFYEIEKALNGYFSRLGITLSDDKRKLIKPI